MSIFKGKTRTTSETATSETEKAPAPTESPVSSASSSAEAVRASSRVKRHDMRSALDRSALDKARAGTKGPVGAATPPISAALRHQLPANPSGSDVAGVDDTPDVVCVSPLKQDYVLILEHLKEQARRLDALEHRLTFDVDEQMKKVQRALDSGELDAMVRELQKHLATLGEPLLKAIATFQRELEKSEADKAPVTPRDGSAWR